MFVWFVTESIEIILEHLSCALTQGDHSVFGYHADELADALARIAVNDKNKVMASLIIFSAFVCFIIPTINAPGHSNQSG